ncbi:MFS transporter [Virgisporangium aurantiacum]|uniref:MFS transporter n=1 Tax=Virgisporangium aurantiacum TaxID=175570 RepID=A0A8J4E3L8_9ACTN|nr:MFS transporter [Virgisporangium aurantiacum]GIJ60189.1 MFS transporter [Virgisporangium aurantiacum]
MRRYLHVLNTTDFRRLWAGATVSTLGDGMTFVALSWLVLSGPGGTAALGLLGICYTAPVLVGGLAVGPLLDRFDKRIVLIADSLLRAAVVMSVPVTAALGAMPDWLPFVVAAGYGLLKMVPLAGFPAAIPQLVEEDDLDAANALESLSFSLAMVIGPAAAGLLIDRIGAADVLLVDGVSFLLFALATATVRPLSPATTPGDRRPSLGFLARDRVIVGTTVAFMAFNVAVGMLMVTGPWLAGTRLPGGAAAFGALLSALAVGEMVGAAVAGHGRPGGQPDAARVRAIGTVQGAAALAFLALLASPRQVPVAAGFFAIGLLSAPMTVWAQSLRMRRIPPALHGRAFAGLRTLMQATPPIGAALVTPLLVGSHLAVAAVAMTLIAGLPALYLIAGRPVRDSAERLGSVG